MDRERSYAGQNLPGEPEQKSLARPKLDLSSCLFASRQFFFDSRLCNLLPVIPQQCCRAYPKNNGALRYYHRNCSKTAR